MNLKCTLQLQIAILLEAEQTLNWKFCLPQGINYGCPLTGWIFWGDFFFFLGWSTQAFGQSFPRLVFISVAVVGALSE